MKRCKTCKWRKQIGMPWETPVCTNKNLCEDMRDEKGRKDQLVYSYQEGGCFHVGEDFGCVHHEEEVGDE